MLRHLLVLVEDVETAGLLNPSTRYNSDLHYIASTAQRLKSEGTWSEWKELSRLEESDARGFQHRTLVCLSVDLEKAVRWRWFCEREK